jgi:uncharacterized protein
MARFRLIIIAVAVLLAIGSIAWLFDSLQRLYWSLATVSPLLAGLLLVLLVVGLVVALAMLIYYLTLFGRPQTPALRPRAPVDRAEAAQESLRAVQQQVNQIQDEVTRQVLLERSEAMGRDLSERDLTVVVFGTGSAGKTSLINAILGRITGVAAGSVGAVMGTTAAIESYRLGLQGLSRDIVLVDTPGLQEVQGGSREQLARRYATEADLLLFVIDNDLRQSEFEILQSLIEIGKRLLLVFNKSDLYLESERQQILERVAERLQNVVLFQDLVTTAANPQPLMLPDGSLVRPDPDIDLLLGRMAAVLRAEGETLVADNILLQSQRLGEEVREQIDQERLRRAEQIVERFQWVGAGVVAVTPLPGVDLLATAAINAQT